MHCIVIWTSDQIQQITMGCLKNLIMVPIGKKASVTQRWSVGICHLLQQEYSLIHCQLKLKREKQGKGNLCRQGFALYKVLTVTFCFNVFSHHLKVWLSIWPVFLPVLHSVSCSIIYSQHMQLPSKHSLRNSLARRTYSVKYLIISGSLWCAFHIWNTECCM